MNRAKLTFRDGRVRYQTVMFPNSPYWAEQIKLYPDIAKIELEIDDAALSDTEGAIDG